ncbi:unnamed protein product [Penicillium egyptiacum]|uniref:RNase III domain-containing protein n=1 Tax=Penicillium egyptiacum TaxID=1303716 RepID=A0A9W4P4T1_9EURO|nr:unnamed protein product [Penicillium egyptiacum]
MSTYLSAEDIRDVEAILGYEFHDKFLLDKAFEAAGATMAQGGNQRLALIGDAALRLVLYELGYESNEPTSETPSTVLPFSPSFFVPVLTVKGTMTMSQNTRATNQNLKRLGESLCLNAYFRLNPSAQGVAPKTMMATTMEAIIGAVYLDSGKDVMTTRVLVIRLGILDNA